VDPAAGQVAVLSHAADQLDSVRNSNRWRVAAIDRAGNRVAAERLDDRTRAVFDGEYLHEHVTLGYAVTVHSAQGAAGSTQAVLGKTPVAPCSRCRDDPRSREQYRPPLPTRHRARYGHQEADGTHLAYRGDSRDAANHNQLAITAHDYAAHTPAAAVGPVEQAASG
jgi:hypothetical protein